MLPPWATAQTGAKNKIAADPMAHWRPENLNFIVSFNGKARA